MSNNLKHYNCTMTVLGPVHIGSGENYRRNEYIYSNRNNSISVLDIGKAYQWFIEQDKAAEFESYFADFSPRSLPLGEWLSARRITETEYSQWIKYRMTAGDSVVVFERGKQKYSDILAFVKDPYSLPYVPGSSIKGMLRTALAMYELSKKKNNLLKLVSAQVDEFDQMTDKEQEDFIRKNKRKFLTKEAVRIETELFNTLDFNDKRKEDGVNCNLSRLIVGDSKPLSHDALTVCKKYDVRTDGSRNELPIFKECLKPGTKIEFDLTIDESVNSKGKSIPYSIEDIKEALRLMNSLEAKRFIRHFEPRYSFDPNETVGWLGSCGFASKTIIQSFFEDSQEDSALNLTDAVFYITLDNLYTTHKHDLDAGKYNVAPHMRKQTVSDNSRYDFGKVKIDFA